MRKDPLQKGRSELAEARSESRHLFSSAFIFSIFVNLLMLTGPLYMLQVYDRVLGSRSEETLIALSALVVFLYAMMGFLDYARGRVLARAGARFQDRLDRRVFSAMLRKANLAPDQSDTKSGLRDLESVQLLLSSPVLLAIFDLPWTPFFLAAIFIFHPWLGYLALGGGGILIVLALLNQRMTRQPQLEANIGTMQANRLSDEIMEETEIVQGLGMREASFDRWQKVRATALEGNLIKSDRAGTVTATTKTLRLFLQSAMLGLGAYLVLQNEMTAGAMIAGSILLGRALAPIEQSIGQWALVQRAATGWQSLVSLLSEVSEMPRRTPLPRPEARLSAEQLTIIPPGEKQATLRMISFDLPPGQAMGVIGPSGAGKSTLAKALTGVWPAAGGKIRLGGAALDQYDADVLGSHIGYLPQKVTLFDGTIGENIARLDPQADPAKIVAAAQKAAAHDLILKQPQGYDTPVTAARGRLSGGELQRIGLARALYGNPVILVLDEPNAALDNDGSNALNKSIREMKADGRSVIIMAHRPSAIQECELLMVLDQGMRRAFGPRDEVLRGTVQNHANITKTTGPGGVT
ncbi:type I secretion system permease/ATPase [Litoreibacter roseus]|uniref:Protease/lipase ABC transporter permease/ATP-binding protein n=1 Tax=Litoreibacter roseus TaxID=2601869 RepID=A0A6N6JF63_9RHOB|nr:type I secretion system permease/ATPase [Litoreibacter roseus]GFE64764.1 protease/lipase ABC transporter permease/ATP-binding protein [Litoreibacter roseus]